MSRVLKGSEMGGGYEDKRWKTEDYENEQIIARALKGKEKVVKGFGGEEENIKSIQYMMGGADMYAGHPGFTTCESCPY